MLSRLLLVVSAALCYFTTAEPVVTLNHGGQLAGRQFLFDNVKVDHFMSIRYAKPPIGDLRFKKPVPTDKWSGVRNVQKEERICSQLESDGVSTAIIGEEDCLFLDVIVPGGVKASFKKPVMIWIHGGQFMIGSRLQYVWTPLAVKGDVIVVNINYRLGILGFLPDGQGTGNFGLWDQRLAIKWVKDNIESFGGDPDKITIFGESAGSASVTAQMLGQHNDGLFQRAIAESGSLYNQWSWYHSDKKRKELHEQILAAFNCTPSDSVYECCRNVAPNDIITKFPTIGWFLVPDGDFFRDSAENEVYSDLPRRFDVLAGYNGQEGGLLMVEEVLIFLLSRNESLENGISLETAQAFLLNDCKTSISECAPELCVDFVVATYGLDDSIDDKERAIRLSYYMGEYEFNAEIYRFLKSHSEGNTATYDYYFTEYESRVNQTALWSLPDWLKKSADHMDELQAVQGSVYLTDDILEPLKDVWDGFLNYFNEARFHADKKFYFITDNMMRMWTNFAKTGNPELPLPLSQAVPNWPQFDTKTERFMEIGSDIKLITTPNKERLDKLNTVLFPAKTKRMLQDKLSTDADGTCEL